MNGRTGHKCQQSGVYRSECHPSQEIPLSKGETFPPCRGAGLQGHATTWTLVRYA